MKKIYMLKLDDTNYKRISVVQAEQLNYVDVLCLAEYDKRQDILQAFFDGIGRAMEHMPDFVRKFHADTAERLK